MIIHDCEQGTPEWLAARFGIVTASEIKTVMSKGRSKNAPSKIRADYMMKLLSERVTGERSDGFAGNRNTERGHVHEPEARALYGFLNDVDPEPVGFITDDMRTCGASPDSLVGLSGLNEIKSKLPHIHIPVMLTNEVPAEHLPQIQTQLWIAEREWCDFISYWPELPLVVIRVYRDEAAIKSISEAVDIFNEELNQLEQTVRAMM